MTTTTTNSLLQAFQHQAPATWAIVSHAVGQLPESDLVHTLLQHWDTTFHTPEEAETGDNWDNDSFTAALALINDLPNQLDTDIPFEDQLHLLNPYLATFLPHHLQSFLHSDCPDWAEAWDIIIPCPTLDDMHDQFLDYLCDDWPNIRHDFAPHLNLEALVQIHTHMSKP